MFNKNNKRSEHAEDISEWNRLPWKQNRENS